MARILKYIYPAANVNDVCSLQNVTANNNLILNGNLANQINSEVSFISYGYSRQISISSVNDLSGRNFTIIGFQNGVEITEDIPGPELNTVAYSTLIYDIVTSITVDNNVNGVNIGTGYVGFFYLIGINLLQPTLNYGLSLNAGIIADAIPIINTTVYSTFYDISQNGTTFLDTLLTNPSLFTVKAQSQESLYILPPANMVICRSILIALTGAADTSLNNSVIMNFIQT